MLAKIPVKMWLLTICMNICCKQYDNNLEGTLFLAITSPVESLKPKVSFTFLSFVREICQFFPS